MDWTGRAPAILLKRRLALIAILALGGCEPLEGFVVPADIEAELRREPGRGGKVGQLHGIAVVNHATRMSRDVLSTPDPRCSLEIVEGSRWIAELTLERRKGESVVSAWTETRTLDYSSGAVAMRLSATFVTEIGGHGIRDTEWRVIGDHTFISKPGRDGDLWFQRPSEEDEATRVLSLGDGMLQALLDAVDGWQYMNGGWSTGDEELRCARRGEGLSFVDRFVASAETRSATLRRRPEGGREFEAVWGLVDGSVIVARFEDRIAPLAAPIIAPPDESIIPIEPDRSLARSHDLLTKLAASGLAEVASTPIAE